MMTSTSQLVCLLAVGIFNDVVFFVIFVSLSIGPEKPYWRVINYDIYLLFIYYDEMPKTQTIQKFTLLGNSLQAF